ncbi:tRNA (adenosine(37)-N6)-threonylcarbamoyltransferase complex transferase subunit TsaD [Faecalispora anaeroviscerum]|uniref:peptidase M22 n=1 Tax=Faecalispora anaeroviscerum TaxID=2991836 RepID=UPI0024BB5EBA|nr:peptidase M22 [Faecalispora anaeroviscerum]
MKKGNTLGIDTSNYTTSAALYWEDKSITHSKRLLPVKEGQLGLRQSDAVFHHVQQLPQILEPLIRQQPVLRAIGASSRPRCAEGSYMPCFSVGFGTAKILADTLGIPLYPCSHQENHIAAALYSADRLELMGQTFLAFHVSGGTTEAVLVEPDAEHLIRTRLLASSLDLKGGQAVDRVGVMLGLSFPAGPELERLALQSVAKFKIHPSMRGCDCSLSGIENQCRTMFDKGAPKEEIARFCLLSLLAALDAMCGALLQEYGDLPVLFAGGVMSNSMIRQALTQRYGASFAKPEFSADNAAGAAILAAIKEEAI